MELINLKRKKPTRGSYYIQQSQLIKYVTSIITRFPYLLLVVNINRLTLLDRLQEENLDLDECFKLLENKDFHHFIYYLFPKLKIKNKETNHTLFMAKINDTHELGVPYIHIETGQKVIPYATAMHYKGNVKTDIQITIFRDAVTPQNEYFCMKSAEFLELYKRIEL